ncbi:MAG TPA: hypothetical protein VKT73_07965 [Xanthobacteraceae bacterium]|nr:hypothetical protein [Xanthobacteraceae bacterium]
MRFADRAGFPELAQRLRLMAAEYLTKAEEAESQMASAAPVVEDPPLSLGVGESLPGANPEPETK